MSSEPTAPPPASPRELIVIARPDAQLNVTGGGAVESGAGFGVESLNGVLEDPQVALRPLFGLSERRLKIKARAFAEETGVEPPDLSVFYRLYAPDEQLEDLAWRVSKEEGVEAAYVKPGAVPAIWNTDLPASPALPPALPPDFSGSQRYLMEAAEGGIDALFARETPGGTGAGVAIIDVEGSWRFSHDDLRENQGGVIGGRRVNDRVWRNHGTAVIGIFSGDENDRGVKGICPGANVMAVSIFDRFREGWGSAAAIRFAADRLGPGDILIIELQRPGPAVNFRLQADQSGNIPVEWWPDDLLAIQTATMRGVVVVAAGGNGRQNLKDPVYDQPPQPPHPPFPADWRNPFRRNPVDSGSILVGAGAPPPAQGLTTRPDLCRLDFSNFDFDPGNDSVFDAQGWGELVTTCGFGDLPNGGGPDEDFWYTGRFSGTSSAAPMVAGALGCVQGIMKARGVAPLTPAEARQLLRSTGSPQGDDPANSPADRRIGNRPDIRQMLDNLPPRP